MHCLKGVSLGKYPHGDRYNSATKTIYWPFRAVTILSCKMGLLIRVIVVVVRIAVLPSDPIIFGCIVTRVEGNICISASSVMYEMIFVKLVALLYAGPRQLINWLIGIQMYIKYYLYYALVFMLLCDFNTLWAGLHYSAGLECTTGLDYWTCIILLLDFASWSKPEQAIGVDGMQFVHCNTPLYVWWCTWWLGSG